MASLRTPSIGNGAGPGPSTMAKFQMRLLSDFKEYNGCQPYGGYGYMMYGGTSKPMEPMVAFYSHTHSGFLVSTQSGSKAWVYRINDETGSWIPKRLYIGSTASKRQAATA